MTGRPIAITGLWLAAIVGPQALGPQTLGVSSRANAHVSMTSHGSFVAVAWSASTESGITDIYAATSLDGGRTVSAPVRVNATAGEARVNGEQPPRVALIAKPHGPPEIVVLWTAKGAAGTRMLTARSTDGGRTFTRASLVPGTDAAGNRGWEAIAADRSARVFAAWLDHRRLAEKESAMAAGHQHGGAHTAPSSAKPDGVAMAQLSDLYVANLNDRSQPAVVTNGVCYCCKTAVVPGPANDVYVAWRHVYPGNLRDIAFAVSRDGGRTFSSPIRVSEDRWEIAGCPDDGPTMAVDAAGGIHIAWPTVIAEGGETLKALFYAVSTDARAFSPRQRIPTQGQANHPQMTVDENGTVIVAWDESGDGPRRIAHAIGRTHSGGSTSFERIASGAGRFGTYPTLASVPGTTLLAWTAGEPAASVIRIEDLGP